MQVTRHLKPVAIGTSFLIAVFLIPRAYAQETPAPTSVTIAGDLQSELGCAGDWDPACTETHLAYDSDDGVWQGTWTVPAGSWEYKATLNDSWDENYGANALRDGSNIGLSLAASTPVKFYYDHSSHWVTSSANAVIAVVPGSFQNELGCASDWDPGCLRSWLQDIDGDGIYTFATSDIPAGSYEAKVAINESWDENYGQNGEAGGANIAFSVPADGTDVLFSYNASTHILTISSGGAAHDNNVQWNELGHNSRDPLYRNPGGPVPTGTPVTLRLRAASGDLTAARVRVWNDRIDTQMLLSMTLVADDGEYEWWQATLPASADPTIYWYRFIAIDGTDTDYYEDDAALTGGWGEALDDTQDRSWQLSVYDPGFQTPDWMKNGVVYQIFPDRFRDADTSNDTSAGTFFYDEVGGTIVRSGGSDWNTPICDPRDPSDCFNDYSNNFYGGDLQGIIDRLDYLDALGVTVIYLNPIFESPSNHKYDTTDYSLIDDNFGSLATFQTLADEAHARGMRLILDGVFNHTSSDSIYFDRYGRYPSLGACESVDSPYRSWYTFSGTGPCDGQGYESWFGYDSLPKLQANSAEVRSLIWSDGLSSIAPYWMQWADGWRLDVGGDVDPGTTNDPTNDYWEGFRTAVHAVKPEAYIVGEEWGNASAWLLGTEWDATMNYQFSSALLSFWRDTEFVDNDHNSGSSAGPITPLTPSQLDERLLNLQERYPPEAFYAMMNLLDSHDTNRALFMLDENTGSNDRTLYEDPNYDWSDAMTRLKGVVLLQMTLPGAPTIYYGDEVGLVAPPTYDGSTWQDDPYNRVPYPWLDASGTPYYTYLQTETGQSQLRDTYTLLANTRSAHPALRTGSFDTLLVDDASNLYAYGRLAPDYSDAAVVIINRASSVQTVTVSVDGYLPEGAQFEDVLNGGSYMVSGGALTVPDVPGRSGALLVLASTIPAAPPATVTDLAVVSESSGEIGLSWSAAAGAEDYQVYRSLLSGGGYSLVTSTSSTTYTDTGLEDGRSYYYVVVSRASSGLASGNSNEAAGIPHANIGWCNVQWPYTIEHTVGVTPTENIYGQVWIDGITQQSGQAPGLLSQVGFGPQGSDASGPGWTWIDATFNVDSGNNDEYKGQLLPEAVGIYDYLYRHSTTNGQAWTYCDRDGIAAPDSYANPGVLTVNPSDDTTAPGAPANLRVVDWNSSLIEMAWDAPADADLYGYDLFRSAGGTTPGERIARVLAPDTTYQDENVVSGTEYTYVVQALDTSFNRSGYSNAITQRAEQKMVAVTFRVRVPEYTPSTVYIAGDLPGLPSWNPNATPMTQVAGSPDLWEIALNIPDGTAGQYKYTRGSWEMVEQWGTITGLTNRQVAISYGSDGTQLVDDTATDWGSGPDDHKAVQHWRDPLIVSHTPQTAATDVALDTLITVTWSAAMDEATDFVVTGPSGEAAGSFSLDATGTILTFTPAAPLAKGTMYTVEVTGEVDAGGNVQQVPASWSFTTIDIDTDGPVTSSVSAVPNPALLESEVTLTATVDDTATGDSNIAAAEYSSDGGATWVSMAASDGAFDKPQEEVSASLTAPLLPGDIALCVRGIDSAGNTGAEACITLTVYDDNLLANGSFELNEDGDRIPDAWKAFNFQRVDGQDCSVAHSGECSVKIAGGRKLKYLVQRISVDGSAGDTVTLSLWAQGKWMDRWGEASVLVTIFYENGSRRYFGLRLPGGSYDWRQLELSFTARRDYHRIEVSIMRWGQHGQLWLDDVKVVKD
jgi:glycosidase